MLGDDLEARGASLLEKCGAIPEHFLGQLDRAGGASRKPSSRCRRTESSVRDLRNTDATASGSVDLARRILMLHGSELVAYAFYLRSEWAIDPVRIALPMFKSVPMIYEHSSVASRAARLQPLRAVRTALTACRQ
jgi:hypothetical protein